MNITRALDVALPEIPARMIAERPPRLHPAAVYKQHVLDGETVVRVFIPGIDAIFNFSPQNWRLAQFFDGARTYEEIASFYLQETGTEIAVEDVRASAEELEAIHFWYKTPQEKNVLLMQQSAEERRKLLKKKSRWGDLGFVTFPAFNPNDFLGWLHQRIKFIYTWWFTAITLCVFAFMGGIFIVHWDELSRDTFQFFNFADKSSFDIAVFWILTLVLSGIHETAHGVSCTHYGARVPAMGFALVYLAPAFYTDVTEGVVRGTQFERLVITVAGVWSELCICSIATILWWGTARGTPIHDFAYTVILITGIAVVLLNWNPLMKLDGYHILCDLLSITELKENSTAYVSAWVKRHVWRLPVEVPFIPKRHRLGFAFYAVLSGAYSYSVLYLTAQFVGNVFHNFNPEWSFVPELATAGLIFRSRIRTLANFMKFLYLDKKDRLRAWFTPARSWGLAVVFCAIFFLPLWHDSIDCRFVLEGAERAVVRTAVPGIVTAVYADEGQSVKAGSPLVQLRNLAIDDQLARSRADYALAASRANSALLRNADFGGAAQERERLRQQSDQLAAESGELDVKSPISGVILTPRVGDRLGSFLPAGTEVAEVANMASLRARIYVSEYEMYHYLPVSGARLEIDGMVGKHDSMPQKISPIASDGAPGLIDLTKYHGLKPPKFYVIDLLVDNQEGGLKPGMAGSARLYGLRRSVAGLAWQNVENFFGRKVW